MERAIKYVLFLSLSLLCLVNHVIAGKHWAVLVAGSKGFWNYRHQADICHAYQVLRKNGIPDEHIVVMMYDDIANNKENPFPGNIINKPNGPNVYPKVPKDYNGHDVTPATFLDVLQGNKIAVQKKTKGSGKVIQSGPDDHIFVYFSDHGAPGLILFPSGELKARPFNNVIRKMHQEKKYAKMTIYIEACESGSMFHSLLPNDINVYATTAANRSESSFGIYYDRKRGTYLGDEYSVHWIEDTEGHNVYKETFVTQFTRVKALTKRSHVQHFGNLSFGSDFLSDFLALEQSEIKSTPEHNDNLVDDLAVSDAIPSEMVRIETLKRRIAASQPDSVMKLKLERELEELVGRNQLTATLFMKIALQAAKHLSAETVSHKFMTVHEDILNWDCYETAIDALKGICPGLKIHNNDLALRKMFILVNLCNSIPLKDVILGIERASVNNPVCGL